MSSRRRDPQREKLIHEVIQAARRNSTAAVMVHTALAERFGLAATDAKTLEILDRLGPQTAGDIATQTGLAPTSVTSLIDRLEQKQLVRRTRDPGDRRRVVVELVPERPREMNEPSAELAAATFKLLGRYSNEQLETILDFLTRGAEMAQAVVGRAKAPPPER